MALELDLKGRAALVTGASSGIGRNIALTLGRAGCDVLVGACRQIEAADEVARQIRAFGSRAAAFAGDLSEPETPRLFVDACRSQLGRLDILVNNAGIWEGAEVGELTPEFVERTLSVNLKSAMMMCRHAVALMDESAAGRIVSISSTASLMGEPLHSVYAASKGALDAMTRSLAVELGPRGITVNTVAPGWTRTDRTSGTLDSDVGKKVLAEIPLGKVAEVDDVAHAVAFLASDWAGHISGVTLPVEGAFRLRR